ncbi:myosin-binding protein 2-like [Cornus florida]|uniref:myosin-binding protein 2-like n=1 Tax=Cornus florida TaxID=4283 RepID=UPI00289E3A93|nr:myosin-binding protein 2-like [Cornus florida]
MAANKFATMLHRNTNKITLILIYAILEWILIILLLLNSLFSYLIIKFADYFGLKTPCLWCSKVDHIFEPTKSKNSHRDRLCEVHAAEISKLGYCSNHRKLAELQEMCEDCSSSRPEFRDESSGNYAFFPLVKQIGVVQREGEKVVENGGEAGLKCSCCGVWLERKFYPPCIVIKPSWGVLDYTQKGNLTAEAGDDEDDDGDHHHHIEESNNWDRNRSDCVVNGCEIENKSDDQMRVSGVNGGFGVKEMEAEEDWSVFVSNSGLKELGGDEDMIIEDDKFGVVLGEEKKPNSDMIIEDPSSDETMIQVCCSKKDESNEILTQHLEFFVGQDGYGLIPIELFDSTTEENQSSYRVKEEGDHDNFDDFELNWGFESHAGARIEPVLESRRSLGVREAEVSAREGRKEPEFAALESMEIEENENSFIFHARECGLVRNVHEQVAITQATQTPSEDVDEVQATVAAEAKERDSEDHFQVSEEVVCQLPISETEVEVSIGTEIPDLDQTDEIQTQVIHSSCQCIHDDPSTSSAYFQEDHGSKETEEETVECKAIEISKKENRNDLFLCSVLNETEEEPVECKAMSIEMSKKENINDLSLCSDLNETEEEPTECKAMSIEMNKKENCNDLSLCSELNETEEEKVPDTPTSMESPHYLHKKLLLLEKRESGTEESLDGSVISEFEGGEGVITNERLKSALKAERKALHALYAELEEERSASAVAANQTMAMITRLQEEKAAMQMEALQYQRMMEEQSEYDQEALQLLNELMVKREKEKQELEKELEIYRKKVLDYEAKENMMRMLRRSKNSSGRSGTPSTSCSNSEDSDGLSTDLNQEAKEEDSFYGHRENGHHNTPVDEVLDLDESLANFEEERLSILEQLKVLEEKLFTLADEEGQHFEDIKPFDYFYKENGEHLDENSDFDGEVNGVENGFSHEMNGKHHLEKNIMGAKAKRLLPLFDAISTENENGVSNGNEHWLVSDVMHYADDKKIKLDNKKHGIEVEVDHLYERLQALEADREFLKHCIGSLKKGDKGMDLLQEILQHLRDLKNVDLRVRNLGDGALV